MAVPERRINQTPNQQAERTLESFRTVRNLANAFELQLTYLALGYKPKGIEVVSFILPDYPRMDTGEPQLWQLTYRNTTGDVCTTSLRKYGGRGPSDSFVSFAMQDRTTRIEWNMYGDKALTVLEN